MIIAVLFVASCAILVLVVGLKTWGRPEEGASEWASALAPELTPSPVEVIRVEPQPRAVEHVGATEAAPATGAIGTLAERPSDDLLTFEQQVAGEPDEWAWFQDALVAYEDALLTRQGWVGVRTSEDVGKPLTLRDMAFPDVALTLVHESTQQRIDRWLSEGGDGVRAARAELRQAVSDTWDAPSQELPLLHQYASDRLAEALLAS